MNAKVIYSLVLVHFSGDFYISFLKPLLPSLATKFSLDLGQVGVLNGVLWLLAFLVQPSVGYLADRYRTRFFVLGGPLLAAVCMSALGLAPTYGWLLCLVALGSVGASFFHPHAAAMVADHAGQSPGFAMALFNLGGTMAFGVGPIVAAWLVDAFGLPNLAWGVLLGLACFAITWYGVPMPQQEGFAGQGFLASLKVVFGKVWKSILLLWFLIVLRSFVTQGLTTFLPMLYDQEGYPLVAIGGVVSIFSVAGAISGLWAGKLADRLGYGPVFWVSFALTPLCLIPLLLWSGVWLQVASFLGGFMTLATIPLAVSLAQEIAPQGKSMVSSLMMGFAFGLGGMLSPIPGELAELFGLRPVLWGLCFLPWVGLVCLPCLPKPPRRAQG